MDGIEAEISSDLLVLRQKEQCRPANINEAVYAIESGRYFIGLSLLYLHTKGMSHSAGV